MRRAVIVTGAVALLSVGSAVVATPARTTAEATVFYLDLKVGTCAKPVSVKRFDVVPCSNGSHRFEVFARVHGGWGATPPAHGVAFARAEDQCLGTFVRRYGGPITTPYGWYAFWPDPGAESAKYRDRIVCTLVRFPGHPPMGPGTHYRQAARR